ncbi:MAG: hypothetical protein HZB41_05700 [Ignavibacteriae bacterium]|nr:hypothetical protein [Ignavibacteriota bacterium]
MNGLYFNIILFVSLFTFITYFLDLFLFSQNHASISILDYFLRALLVGFIFFLLMTKLAFLFKYPRFREKEPLIKEQGAHHITKYSYIPGKLFLTPTRLIFKSQKGNPKQNISIPLESSNSFSIYKMFGFITMGLIVKCENTSEVFIVNGPKRWIQALQTFK